MPAGVSGRPNLKTAAKKFNDNVVKRGNVPKSTKKSKDYPVGVWTMGFLLFVVVGSSLFQLIRSAQAGQM